MSGYRSFHRETLGSFPIWQVASSPLLCTGSSNTANNQLGASWRIWVACGDGVVRGYLVVEKTLETQTDSTLDAAACRCTLTHVLLGASQEIPSAENDDDKKLTALGCSQVQVARNYVGDDDKAGDLIVVSSDLAGNIRIWVLPEDMDNDLDPSSLGEPSTPEIAQEFTVANATGTCIKVIPPNTSGVSDVLVAVPCLDGTIALVATGLSTPKSKNDPTAAGVVVERWSKAASSIALSGAWNPTKKSLAVGRQDGLVEILGDRSHRLIQHEAPVRSVSFTPDGNLMVSASDDGMICMWDMSRSVPVLVQHIVQGHATWVLGLVGLFDSRRFVSCGADRQLHVWSASQMDQALHSFTSDDVVWTIDALTNTNNRTATTFQQTQSRLVSGSENGGLHIYTLES